MKVSSSILFCSLLFQHPSNPLWLIQSRSLRARKATPAEAVFQERRSPLPLLPYGYGNQMRSEMFSLNPLSPLSPQGPPRALSSPRMALLPIEFIKVSLRASEGPILPCLISFVFIWKDRFSPRMPFKALFKPIQRVLALGG